MTAKTAEQKAAEAKAADKAEDAKAAEAQAKIDDKEQAASEEKVAEARAAEVPLKDEEKVVMHSTSGGPLQDGNVLDHPAPRRGDPYAAQRPKADEGKKSKK